MYTKLHQIINSVTANGMREWTDERVEQAMREFATLVAKDALKTAANTIHRYKEMEHIGFPVCNAIKESILSTPINIDL